MLKPLTSLTLMLNYAKDFEQSRFRPNCRLSCFLKAEVLTCNAPQETTVLLLIE
jgi:hypothetical protein